MEKEKQRADRPLCLELQDAKQEIFSAISTVAGKRKIPFFLLESVVYEAYVQVKEGASKEREQAESFYKNQLTETEKEEN